MEITKNSPRQQSCHTDSGTPYALLRCTEAQKCLSVTPLLATLTHSVSRKSFPCHSYANTRDGDATVAPISASVSLCLSFKPPVSSLQPPASRLKSPGSVGGYALPILPVRSVFSVPARRPAGGPLPAPRLGRGGKSLFSSSLPYLFRYVSTPELLLPSIHSANITKVQTRGAAGVAGSRADKPWQP